MQKKLKLIKRIVRWASSLTELPRTKKALDDPHHSENYDSVSSQTGDVMPDSQSGSFCTAREVSRF